MRGTQRMIGGCFLREPIHISINVKSARDGRFASRFLQQRPKPGMSETASIRCH
ncbi:hypothetical protein [Caballeronia glebae]|uniref:hypothetical protein n=1 Tax=Caballeronia glebae TaxID=1777143 RepID=UPI0038BBD313